MRAHPPEVSMTEFLAKSLVAAGVVLSIPASLSAALAARMLWGTWPYRAWSYVGWLAFCCIGFFLLVRNIQIVRAPERVRRPQLVWLGTSAYLATILAMGITWLLSSFHLARQGGLRDWGGDTLEPDILVFPALLLLLPLWAFILSTALFLRRKCARPST